MTDYILYAVLALCVAIPAIQAIGSHIDNSERYSLKFKRRANMVKWILVGIMTVLLVIYLVWSWTT